MVSESGFAIELLCSPVVPVDLKMNGFDSFFTANRQYKRERCAADSLLPVRFPDIEFVYQRIAPMEFEAKTKRQNDVAGQLLIDLNKVNGSESVVGNDLFQTLPGFCRIVRQMLHEIKLLHKLQQQFNV